MKHCAKFFSVIVLFFAVATFAHAQTQSTPVGSLNDLSVGVSPEIPQANQVVTLTLKTYLVNLSSADINWSIDGKSAQHGIGIDSFTFTTKDVGMPTKIDVSVLPVNGYVIKKSLTITPSSIDILWEATDSAVPPFYKGKALPTTEATIKYVAIPNMKTNNGMYVSPKDIIYNWSNNYQLDSKSSGYGKDSYTFKMPFTDQGEIIDVTGQMRGGGLTAQNEIKTSLFDPQIIWYLSSPLYGPQFDKAINTGYTVTSNDVSIFAEPFFASPKNILASNLSYTWELNNQTLDAQTVPNVLILHRNDTNKGDAVVNLTIENSEKYLQELTSLLTLHLQ